MSTEPRMLGYGAGPTVNSLRLPKIDCAGHTGAVVLVECNVLDESSHGEEGADPTEENAHHQHGNNQQE